MFTHLPWLPIFVALAGCSANGCGANSPNALDVSSYGTEQFECVQNADARPAADSCRAASKARFCARFPSLQDCFTDGGK